MPKKACCCKTNCCDEIFYSNFIILAGETLDDAAPVHPDDIVMLVMNRPGGGGGPVKEIYPSVPSADCYCVNCEYMRAYWCHPAPDSGSPFCNCDIDPVYCRDNWYSSCLGDQCGPSPI